MTTLAEVLARGLYVSFQEWPYNAGGINCHISGAGVRGLHADGRGATPEAALAAAWVNCHMEPSAPKLPGLPRLPGLPGLPRG